MVAKKITSAEPTTPGRKRRVIAVDPSPPSVAGPTRDLSPAASAGGPEPEPARTDVAPSHVVVEVYHGDIAALPADVAVVGRYKGIGARGNAASFDKQLGGWLSSAFQHGMVGSDLGELFYIPISRAGAPQGAAAKLSSLPPICSWPHAPAGVIVAGLGEPGRFNREGLRYLLTNITLAVVALGYGKLSLPPLGFSRREILLENVLRGTLEGISEALDRFDDRADRRLVLRLIHAESDKAKQMYTSLEEIGPNGIDGLVLEIHDRLQPEITAPNSGDDKKPAKTKHLLPRLDDDAIDPVKTTRITITCAGDTLDARQPGKSN
jgi:hypothetical protein